MEFFDEAEFQRWVISVARAQGWVVVVAWVRESDAGAPDLVLFGPGGKVIAAELKTGNGQVRPVQRHVHRALLARGADVRVWRPTDAEAIRLELEEGVPPQPEPRRLAIGDIIHTVARELSVSAEEMCGVSRARHVARPRAVAMYLAREMTDEPLAAIGRAFGNRNHTTVLHAWKRVDRSPVLRADADVLRRSVHISTGLVTTT
jgi:hypothetical protein